MDARPTAGARPLKVTPRVGAAVLAMVWGCALIAGALRLRYSPPAPGTFWDRLLSAEPVHIAAHLFLYGMLAAIGWVATRRLWASVLIVAVFAIAQEGAQSVWWGRWFGRAEFFDFGVDAVGATVALALMRSRLSWRPHRRSDS